MSELPAALPGLPSGLQKALRPQAKWFSAGVWTPLLSGCTDSPLPWLQALLCGPHGLAR